MFKKKYIIIPIICFIIFAFYYVITYLKKQIFIQQILDKWKLRTNGGYIKYDNLQPYYGDYYLTFDKFENYETHIHFITLPDESNRKNNSFQKCNDLCYIINRDNIHSPLYEIDVNKSAQEVVDEILVKYNNFDF